MKSSRKGLKICCGITTSLIVVALVTTALFFTILKPKEPEITVHPIGQENTYLLSIFTVKNITINMTMTINNHGNVESFKFKNSTAYVNYRGYVVAEVPVEQNLVPAHGKLNITASTDLMVEKIISNPVFFDDVSAGSLKLTSTAALHGKLGLLKFVKIRAKALSTCDISFSIFSRIVQSTCTSKFNL